MLPSVLVLMMSLIDDLPLTEVRYDVEWYRGTMYVDGPTTYFRNCYIYEDSDSIRLDCEVEGDEIFFDSLGD